MLFFKNSATSLTTPCPLQCPPLLLPQTLDSSSEFLTQPTTPHPHYYHSNLDLCLFLTNLQTAVFSFFQYNLDLYIIGNLIIHLHQRDHCSKTHLLPTCYEINPYSLAVFACSFIYPFTIHSVMHPSTNPSNHPSMQLLRTNGNLRGSTFEDLMVPLQVFSIWHSKISHCFKQLQRMSFPTYC